MKRTHKLLVLLLAASALRAACPASEPPATNAALKGPPSTTDLFPDTVLAKGKNVEVKRNQFDDEVIKIKAQYAAHDQNIPAEQMSLFEQQILNGLIQMQLLKAKATDGDKLKGKEQFEKSLQAFKESNKLTDEELNEKLGPQLRLQHISKEQWEQQQIDQATLQATVERELKISISDEDAKKYYEDNPPKFEQAEMVRASHILLATQELKTHTELSDDQKAAKRKLAEDLLKRARAGEDFAKLAKQYSDDDGSKDKGGEYTFRRGLMQPEFEAAAFSLNTNQISDIVTTLYGYHIIKVLEKIPAKKLEFAKVSDRIKEDMAQQAMQKQFPQYIAQLKKDANVEILDEKLKPKEGADATGLPAGQPPVKTSGQR